MCKVEIATYLYLNQIFVKKIVLDEKDYVTILGYIFDNKTGDIKVWDYVTPTNILIDILLLAKNKGNVVIKEINKKILAGIAPPEVIDVQKLLGHTLKINDISICASEPRVQNAKGKWILTDRNCYIIESVMSF